MATDTAKNFDALAKKINALHPIWTKRPALSYLEQQGLIANSKAFFQLEEPDWRLLKAYLGALIPETWGKFWQPDSRSRFIESISDVLGHSDRWKAECKKRKVATGLEEVKS